MLTGIFLNYDLLYNESSHYNYVSGIQELNYFCPQGTLTNSVLINSKSSYNLFHKRNKSHFDHHNNYHNSKRSNIIRLDTYWTYDDPQNITRLQIGDNITTPAYWSGSTRFLGIKYGTNFSIRPDFITRPLLAFSGNVELPTAVDIYRNSLPIYKGKVNAGPFDIINLPTISGRGELTANIIDVTGKVSTITIPYYSDPKLLKENVSDYSFEIGAQRRNYSIKNNLYKNFLVNYNYLYGVTDNLTSGFHFESLQDYSTVGVTNNLKLDTYGVVSLSLVSNIHKIKNAQKFMVAYNYQDQKFNFYASINQNYNNYIDIYSYNYHSHFDNNSGYYYRGLSKPHYQITAGYTHKILGSFSVNFLSYTYRNNHHHHNRKNKYYNEIRKNIISTSYNKNIFQNGFTNFTIGTEIKKKHRESFCYLTVGMSLDNKSVSLGRSRHNKHISTYMNISSSPKDLVGWRYNANIIKSKSTDYNIQVSRYGEKMANSLYLHKFDKTRITQFGIQGSILAIKNNLFFSRQYMMLLPL